MWRGKWGEQSHSRQTNENTQREGENNSYRCGPPKYNCSLQVEESVGVHLKHYKNSQVLAMMICSCVCVCARALRGNASGDEGNWM